MPLNQGIRHFEKLPVFWQPKGRPALREIYRDLIRLRRERRLPQHKRRLAAQLG